MSEITCSFCVHVVLNNDAYTKSWLLYVPLYPKWLPYEESCLKKKKFFLFFWKCSWTHFTLFNSIHKCCCCFVTKDTGAVGLNDLFSFTKFFLFNHTEVIYSRPQLCCYAYSCVCIYFAGLYQRCIYFCLMLNHISSS